MIVRKDRPIKLRAVSTYRLAFSVKEEIVYECFVGLSLNKVVGSCDIKCLDEFVAF